jgi:hypothetical protein
MVGERLRSPVDHASPATVAAAGRAGWRLMSLDGASLNRRIARRLAAAGIRALGDLAEWSPEALRSLRGIHAVSVLEIELCLIRAQNAKRPIAGRIPRRLDQA